MFSSGNKIMKKNIPPTLVDNWIDVISMSVFN